MITKGWNCRWRTKSKDDTR